MKEIALPIQLKYWMLSLEILHVRGSSTFLSWARVGTRMRLTCMSIGRYQIKVSVSNMNMVDSIGRLIGLQILPIQSKFSHQPPHNLYLWTLMVISKLIYLVWREVVGISYKYGKTSGIRHCQIHHCSRCMVIFFVSFHAIDIVQTKLALQWISMYDRKSSQQCCCRSQWRLLGGCVASAWVWVSNSDCIFFFL